MAEPTQVSSSQLLSDLHGEFASLAHRTLTLSYGVLAVLVLVIGMACAGGYMALKGFNTLLDKAQTQQAAYTAQLDAFRQQLAQDSAERQQANAKIADLEAQVARRATAPPPPVVQTGLQPNASVIQVKNALDALYASDPAFGPVTASPDSTIALTTPQAQKVAITKVQLDTETANFQDEKQIVDLQNGNISSLTNDLNQCKDTLTGANKTIADYKRVVKPSRWQRFISGAKTVAKIAPPVLAIGILIGSGVL
jgi:hypothetical protein